MATTAGTRSDTRFFGHPLGLMTLFGTELWERFSYYGMRAILFYFITDTFANGGLGLDRETGVAITAQLVSATEDLAESYVPFLGTIGGVTLGLAALFFLVAPWIQRRIAEGEEDAPAPAEH